MKDREIQCKYYINEGNCAKGHSGTFRKQCQTCSDYAKKKGVFPRRKDLRKVKLEALQKDKRNWE